ncbi:MAG: hypothetical protein AABM64_15710 [Pseudomonadota bacterium]
MNEDLRVQRLDQIKSNNPHSEMEIFYKADRRKLPVFQIPLDVLIYNKYNGRIASHVKSFERQVRELDAAKPEDKIKIEEFLYRSNSGRNKQTLEDLKKHKGQLRYGIVTRDGVIIDGNRRAMLLGRIAKDANQLPGYFFAVILDDRLADDQREIMRLETTYQLGEDEKLGYNAIEKYLKVKDLRAVRFSDKEIAAMMSEPDDESIARIGAIMALMDRYLELLDYEGIYTRLDDTEGIFVDLHQYLTRYKKPTRLADWQYKEQDLAELETIFFDLIRARFSGDGKLYRDLGRPSKKESFFCNEKVWKEFRENHFKNVELINQKEKSVDQLRRENPGKTLDVLLLERDKDWTDLVSPDIKKNFGKSQRLLDDINAQNAPLELLRRAFQTLQNIDVEAETFWNDPEVEKAVAELNTLTYDFKKIIKEKRKQ